MTRVTIEQVRRVMDAPPDFIEVSYLPAWRAGRISTADLAHGVTATLGHSPYDGEMVDQVSRHLEALGYGEPVAAVWV